MLYLPQERQRLLDECVECVDAGFPLAGGSITGRLLALVPDRVLLGDTHYSREGRDASVVNDMFDRAIMRNVRRLCMTCCYFWRSTCRLLPVWHAACVHECACLAPLLAWQIS